MFVCCSKLISITACGNSGVTMNLTIFSLKHSPVRSEASFSINRNILSYQTQYKVTVAAGGAGPSASPGKRTVRGRAEGSRTCRG
jgi:hypothetical protein